MLKSASLSWPLSLSLALVALILAVLPFLLTVTESLHDAWDGGGLAALVDADETVAFFRTESPNLASSFLRFLQAERELPLLDGGGVYELAMMRAGSGETMWVYAISDATLHVKILVSPVGIIQNIPEPLRPLSRETSFHRFIRSGTREFLWFRPQAVPESSSALRALLSPASVGLLTWAEDGTAGSLTLVGSPDTVQKERTIGPFPPADASTVFFGSVSSSGWMRSAWETLLEIDPGLADGIEGIGLALLRRTTGSTDLLSFLRDTGDAPFTVMLSKDGTSTIPFVAGAMRSSEATEEGKQRVRSEHAVGLVRRIDLLGENVRVDVSASGSEEVKHGEWVLTSLSDAGTYVAATNGNRFLIGTSDAVVAALDGGGTVSSFAGSMEIDWAVRTLGLPVDLATIFLQNQKTRIMWNFHQGALERSYDWRFE